MFKLALLQMRVDGGAKAANLARAERMLAEAAAAGAQVALLPETMDLGWTHGSARQDADLIPDGETCTRLRAAAERHGLHICAGLVERSGARLYNAAVFIGPRGDVLLHHRKINELDFAHDLYAQGDRLGVAETPFGTFGLMICADAFACGQVVSRTLALMGAGVILSPCAWAVPADYDHVRTPYGQLWLDHYGAVARDANIWVAGCSNVGLITDGPWSGRQCIGSSLVIAPGGQPALRGPSGSDAEALLLIEVTPEKKRCGDA